MRQRIVIAIALASNAKIMICDEPTTALDVTIQAKILDEIKSIKKSQGLSVIFITHDLGVVANMADRICVMYAGMLWQWIMRSSLHSSNSVILIMQRPGFCIQMHRRLRCQRH